MKGIRVLFLAVFLACSGSEQMKEEISIISAVPPSGAKLESGAVVDFILTVKYSLASAESGTISIVVQDQTGRPISRFPSVARKIGAGKGDLTLSRSIWIPNSVSRVDLFTPLYPKGETKTLIADYVSYEVNAASRAVNATSQLAQDIRALKFPQLELSSFLPDQKESGNAATFYTQALEYYSKENEAINLRDDLEQLSKRAMILKAMAKIFDGAHIRRCDFTMDYSLSADLVRGQSPDFGALSTLARAMVYCSDQYVAKNDFQTANKIARCIVAFGKHLIESSYFSPQHFFGLRIEIRGAQQFLGIAQATNNHDEQEKAISLLETLEKIESIYKAKLNLTRGESPFSKPLPSLPASAGELLINLQDAEPIFRIESLQIIGTLYNTGYDNDPQLELFKDANFKTFTNSRSKDLPVIREKIHELSTSDPDARVREVAKLVLVVLDKFSDK